jgi:hypothetical protein
MVDADAQPAQLAEVGDVAERSGRGGHVEAGRALEQHRPAVQPDAEVAGLLHETDGASGPRMTTTTSVGVAEGLNTAPYRTIDAPRKLESTRIRASVRAAATRRSPSVAADCSDGGMAGPGAGPPGISGAEIAGGGAGAGLDHRSEIPGASRKMSCGCTNSSSPI